MIAGMPAVDIKKWGRAAAAFTRLPDMLREVRRLRKDLNALSKKMHSSDDRTDAKE